MIMLRLIEKASDVRQHFSEFIDTVVRDRPGFLTRNRDVLATLNMEHVQVLLEPLQFHANIRQNEHGAYVGTLQEIDDIVATGTTEQEVIAEGITSGFATMSSLIRGTGTLQADGSLLLSKSTARLRSAEDNDFCEQHGVSPSASCRDPQTSVALHDGGDAHVSYYYVHG